MNDRDRQQERDVQLLISEKYHDGQTADFYVDIEELKKGVPLAYVIGTLQFLGCTIDLSRRPLIPRSETEFWVERAISYIREKNTLDTKLSILDIFSGSGCIGVALAKHLSTADIDFAEKEAGLISQIVLNLKNNMIETSRTHAFKSDVFTNIPLKKYDYIFANPPYISKERIADVQRSVLEHEPHKALFADDDGAYYIKKLITEGSRYLTETGTMFIEIDPHQKNIILEYAKNMPCVITFWNDHYGHVRVAVVSFLNEKCAS